MPLKAFACRQNSNARCWKPCSGRGRKAKSLPRAQRSDLGPPLRVHLSPRNRASMPGESGSSVASKHPADHENKAPTHRDSSGDASSRLIVPNPAERARTPSSPQSSAASSQKASSWLFLATSRFGDASHTCDSTASVCQTESLPNALKENSLCTAEGNPFNEVCPRDRTALLLQDSNQATKKAPEAIPQRRPRKLQPREHCGLAVVVGTRNRDSSWNPGSIGSTAE